MRSRYSAFAMGEAGYLFDTWDPSGRPATVELGDMRWTRLEIVETVRGGPFDADGVVEFRAHYRVARMPGTRHERSWFAKKGGRWVYVSGDTFAS